MDAVAAGNLPDDVMRDILQRFPVKSILRFRCVHKSWNSLFKSSSFIANHSKSFINNKNHGFFLVNYLKDPSRQLWIRLLTHDPFRVYLDVELPFTLSTTSSSEYIRIVGSCNGLVCFYDDTQIFIYNPLLNQHKTLPRPINNVSPGKNGFYYTEGIGFGYDSLSNHYKVVFWYSEVIGFGYDNNYSLGDDDHVEGYSKDPQFAEVYTLGMNCWRNVRVPDHDIIVDKYNKYHKSPAFLNGAIHWLGYDFRSKVVISFNVSIEEFQLLPLPDYVSKDARTMEIDVYRDMLCVVNSVGMDNWNYDIWVMSEYGVPESWTKQLVLEQELPLPGNFYVRDLRGIMMNGELVWLSYIYNHEYRGQNPAVDIGKPNSKPIIFDDGLYLKFSTYTQSLVSP